MVTVSFGIKLPMTLRIAFVRMGAFPLVLLPGNAFLSQSKPSMALEIYQHSHVYNVKYIFHMGENLLPRLIRICRIVQW